MTSSQFTSGTSEPIERAVYHEAGHAVMAHLFGRTIHSINLTRNVADTYNGRVDWGLDDHRRKWDPNVPYDRLGLKEGGESRHMEPLVAAAGKAAERVRFRQRGLDEGLAWYGAADERELEGALRRAFRSVTDENLSEAKSMIDDLAIKLLSDVACWAAIEALAQDLLTDAQALPEYVHRDEEHVDALLAKSFQATA